MSEREVAFLRDQVSRLNKQLERYQSLYFGTSADLLPASTEVSTSTPWLTDSSILSPLIHEYDRIIQEVNKENDTNKNEHKKLKEKVEELVTENNRLVKELKESLQAQVSPVDVSNSHLVENTDDDQLIVNLQQQVHLAIQEKEKVEERLRESFQEIDRLERTLQSVEESHQWKVVNKQANQVKDQYFHTVAELNTEIQTLQSESRQTKSELATANILVTDLRRTISDLQQQLKWKDEERNDALFKEGISDGQNDKYKMVIDELTEKLNVSHRECNNLRKDKEMLEVRSSELQKRLGSLDDKGHDAALKFKNAIQMAEKAIMEKDQAEIQLGQKDEEIDNIQEVINKLIHEAGARTRQEVDIVRKQSNDRLSKLTEELHTMEMENAEKQAQIDRLLREKRSVESELEKIYKEGMVHGSKENMSYHELNQRAINAERTNCDLELKLESVQATLKRETLNSEKLKEQMDTQFTQLKDRMVSMETELSCANEECLRKQDEIDELKSKVQSAIQEKEQAQRKYYKELAILEQDKQMKIRDYEVKVQSTEDTNRHAITELRKLLTSQQRMAAKWKEECQSITKKFEVKIQDLRDELNHKQKRNEEITALLKESQEKTIEAGKTMAEATRNIRRMEERVRESEGRAAESTRKLSRSAAKCRQMESERQSLLQELTKSQRELSRSNKGSLHSSGELISSHRSSNGHYNGVSKITGNLEMEDLQASSER